MAELNLEEVDHLVKTNLVKKGILQLTDQEINIFEGPDWKDLLSALCYRFLEIHKEIIYEENIISFFPREKDDYFKMMAEQNTTFMGESMVRPLFCVKFNKDKNIEVINRCDSKIPKEVVYTIFGVV